MVGAFFVFGTNRAGSLRQKITTKLTKNEIPTRLFFSLGGQLEKLMDDLHNELSSNPPLPGSYTARKGDLCAALFVDNNWYVLINMSLAYSVNGEETYFLMC